MSTKKTTTQIFLLRIATLVAAIFIITLGSALCIRANLGNNPVTVLPYAWSLAGGTTVGSFHVPHWTIGTYTYIFDVVLVLIQMLILRRRYQPIQLLQLAIASVFAVCLDLNMYITAHLQWTNIVACIVQLFVGGTIMAFGLTLEVTARLIYKPGVGTVVTIVRVTHIEIGIIKMCFDCTCVLLATISMLVFFHTWHWHIVGIGTLISMIYVGFMVKTFHPVTARIQNFIFS